MKFYAINQQNDIKKILKHLFVFKILYLILNLNLNEYILFIKCIINIVSK